MALGNEPLLAGGDGGTTTTPSSRWTRAAAVLLGSGALVLLARSAVERSGPRGLFDQRGAALWGEDLRYNDPRCMMFTGGTCRIFGCNADRGPTSCTWWHWGHKCMCQEGYCATELGKCRRMNTSTQIVDHTFILKNVQWPDYHLNVPNAWSGQVTVSNDEINKWSKFRLFQVPVARDVRPTQFMLGSAEYPDHLIETSRQRVCRCTSHDTDSDGDRECVSHRCHMEYAASSRWISKPVREQKLKIFQANYEEPALMIEGMTTPNRFWYIPRFSWTLGVSDPGDPGPQGYWIADPPLPEGLLLPPPQ